MSDTDPKVDKLLAGITDWRDEVLALRALLLESPLKEEFKWRSPVYTHDGANVAIIWGFKDRASLGFFKGVLLKDSEGILEAPGDNSRSSRGVNFTDTARIEALKPVLLAYIDEAIANEKAGLKVDFPKDDLDYPEELVARLDSDTDFRTAFEALTPGRRRGWVLHFSQAKQSATRASRIDKAAPRILQGKGMQDR
ncbi:YdeI/OmpD-associated family protein [Paracoccus caeni]|uniref:YdeI/OmpD-associated family protein n=1 Tax=Paracoccus caeni TaxID=657651 RepID=A0A934W0F3_9RHOB|nr:YdeI/OmpD-associated family protein [Paracoccus caeni]MBK4216273.1 YdeI/OmpD-associated family protein [Paracoccus caeni]